jgi:hypothetical protein
VEDEGEIDGEFGAPAGADGGAGVVEALEQWTGPVWWVMERQIAGAGEEFRVGAGVFELNGEIDRRRACTDDKNAFALECGDVAVVGAVADEFGREARELRREPGVGGDADGENDAAGVMELAGGGFHLESAIGRADSGDPGWVEVGNEAALELTAIVGKLGTRYGQADLIVGKTVVATIVTERIARCGCVKIRGEALGLEKHSGRHVVLPGVHAGAEDAEVDAEGSKMGCKGKSIGTRTDDSY